jgi:hypothetical protein
LEDPVLKTQRTRGNKKILKAAASGIIALPSMKTIDEQVKNVMNVKKAVNKLKGGLGLKKNTDMPKMAAQPMAVPS